VPWPPWPPYSTLPRRRRTRNLVEIQFQWSESLVLLDCNLCTLDSQKCRHNHLTPCRLEKDCCGAYGISVVVLWILCQDMVEGFATNRTDQWNFAPQTMSKISIGYTNLCPARLWSYGNEVQENTDEFVKNWRLNLNHLKRFSHRRRPQAWIEVRNAANSSRHLHWHQRLAAVSSTSRHLNLRKVFIKRDLRDVQTLLILSSVWFYSALRCASIPNGVKSCFQTNSWWLKLAIAAILHSNGRLNPYHTPEILPNNTYLKSCKNPRSVLCPILPRTSCSNAPTLTACSMVQCTDHCNPQRKHGRLKKNHIFAAPTSWSMAQWIGFYGEIHRKPMAFDHSKTGAFRLTNFPVKPVTWSWSWSGPWSWKPSTHNEINGTFRSFWTCATWSLSHCLWRDHRNNHHFVPIQPKHEYG